MPFPSFACRIRVLFCPGRSAAPFLLAGLAAGALLFATARASAEVVGDLDALVQIADLRDAQQDVIKTWQGTCEVTATSWGGEGARPELQVTKTSFFLDRPADLRRWCTTVTGNITSVLPDGRTEHPGAMVDQGMLKGERFYWSMALPVHGVLPPRQIYILSRATGRGGWMPHAFNPAQYDGNVKYDLGPYARMLYHKAKDLKPHFVVARHGDLVSITTESGTLRNEFVFDMTKDANLISYHATDADGGETHFYEYERQGKIWVLKRSTAQNAARAGGLVVGPVQETTVVFDSKVNQPVSAAEFTLGAMGLKPGDLITDRVSKTSRRYDPEAGDEADAPPPAPAASH